MRQLKIIRSVTNREDASLEKYLQDIGKERLITTNEEIQLAQRIRQGDPLALEELIKSNLRFVVSVAKQYQNQGLSLPDLINEGNLGLIEAAKRFDETRGFKFISYAVWWIRQKILESITTKSRTIRLPLNQVGHSNKVKKAISKLEQKLERTPSVEEIAEEVEMFDHEVREIFKFTGKIISTDVPLLEGEGDTFFDIFIPDDSHQTDKDLMKESLAQDLFRAIKTLSRREEDVIKMFFGINMLSFSLEEIGKEFGLTKERTRQIKEKALRKLKSFRRSNLLKKYL